MTPVIGTTMSVPEVTGTRSNRQPAQNGGGGAVDMWPVPVITNHNAIGEDPDLHLPVTGVARCSFTQGVMAALTSPCVNSIATTGLQHA